MIQKLIMREITATETLTNLNTLAVANGSSTDALTLSVDDGSGDFITLGAGQSISLNASSGFVLPPIIIDGTGLTAEVVYS